MVKSKTQTKILVAIFLLSLLGVLFYFLVVREQPKPFIEIDAFYDANGNVIQGYSIIGSIQGVKYVTFRINVENKDNIPLNLRVTELTPRGLGDALPPQTLNVGSGQTGIWITGKIDIEPYEGTIQDFCAVVESDKVFVLRGVNEVRGCIDLHIKPNPIANDSDFQVEIDSSVGEGTINPSCEENWICSLWSICIDSLQTRNCQDTNECETNLEKPIENRICEETPFCSENWVCGSWSDCFAGIQTRMCNDANGCGSTINMPETSRGCTEEVIDPPAPIDSNFDTNSIGDYRQTGIWISIEGKTYYYFRYSTYDCLPENIFLYTPEGYPICTRPGYDISDRVYLQQDNWGIIFKP